MPNVDRSQLIAAFALQMSFIDQDQFRAAMCVWNCEKSRLLDEILLEHESLDRETHALLVAIVDKHLEKRDGNAEASLASLPAPAIGLHEMLGANVSASLPRLSADADDDPFKTINCEAGRSPSYAGRFRITGLPNKGGMGQVSSALDEELNREVALKEIRLEYADDLDCRVRFVQEAEITGGLEHPGIVPVYGLGSYPDGRPFYAMRFLYGNTLQHAIDRFHASVEVGTRSASSTEIDPGHPDPHRQNGEFESFEFRKLLGRFIDVCNAIEYAHSRGVIHRDLMPMFAAMQGQPTPSDLASARRQCLRLGELIFWVSVVAWTGAGLVFPAWIDFVLQLSGDIEKGPGAQQYVHFFAAHVLCGLVSGAIVMSSLSFVAVRLFYPRLLRSSGAVDVRADGLLERSKRIDRFNSLAAGVPFFALVYINFVDTDYKLSIMAMVLLGLLLMYLLAVKAIPEVKADLEALALLPVAFRSETRV